GAGAAGALRLGPAEPFDFTRLRERARQLAAAPYRPPVLRATDIIDRLDYDAHRQIRFRMDEALWADGGGPYAVAFFHLGRFFKEPVRIHVVEAGEAREVLYAPAYFDIPADSPAAALPPDIGFAGFRIMNPGGKGDWLAFLGASYFRSAGALDQYGLSARGLAIDTGLSTPEEFPRFSEFWLEAPPDRPGPIDIYALLEGPSVAGAYRMAAWRDRGVRMEIRAELFLRAAVQRLGIAPLTSMFWYGENNRGQARDWRPEIHDSDGLAIWAANGERVWRPLADPPGVQTNSFYGDDVRGFGLLQRDRDFDHYQDDQVFYDRRPSAWVEPLEPWGAGVVQLVELYTEDETHDNVVAYWVPKEPARAGSAWSFAYRLHWTADEPYPSGLARVVATRLGRGGNPGQPHPPGRHKFAIDLAGGPLPGLGRDAGISVFVTASRGTISDAAALPVVGTDRWRVFFDLTVDGAAPVDLRMLLQRGARPVSETWLYQFFPAGG
ncbi:MAG: glucan biosynthesis protein D, partial [Rhodospirillaceae bacterium]|nr:glucan biosynthesis protein D [Rhodospirillaceae bacterium]